MNRVDKGMGWVNGVLGNTRNPTISINSITLSTEAREQELIRSRKAEGRAKGFVLKRRSASPAILSYELRVTS